MSKSLPVKPNLNHLKVQAKRLKQKLAEAGQSIQLQAAQNRLARDYGFLDWASLTLHLQRLDKVEDLVNRFIWTPGKAFPALRESGIVDLKIVEAGTRSPKPKIRRICLQLLDHLGAEDCADILAQATFDPEPRVRLHAVHALGCQNCKAQPFLKETVLPHLLRCAMDDPNEKVRYHAIWGLGDHGHDPKIVKILECILRETTSPRLQRAANHALAQQKKS